MSKQWYEVKPGYTHGKLNEHKPGDKVELSVEDASAFLDKLRLIEPSAEVARGEQSGNPASAWGDLPAKTIAALETAGMTPETVKAASDEQLLTIEGIGPAALKAIREA